MEKKRIVITGLGVVAPNGIGKEAFWRNCLAGVSGIRPITRFHTASDSCQLAGEIQEFQPETYLGSKGLRNLDRTTLLALVAAKLALDDAHLEVTSENCNQIGVVLASSMGSIHSISEFDKEGIREGPRYVNPSLFPSTVMNSPASQVAIRFGMKALNATISTGFTASLDAIGYAMDMLRLGRAEVLLVGAVEELCAQLYLGFQGLGLLSSGQNGAELKEDSGLSSGGTFLGEGAAFLVLQCLDEPVSERSTDLLEIAGYGTYFDPHPGTRFSFSEEGPVQAVHEALRDAGCSTDEISHWASYANSAKPFDDVEERLVSRLFAGRTLDDSAQIHLNKLIGESFSADGLMRLVLMAGVLQARKLPQRVSNGSVQASERPYAVVAGYSPIGSSSAVVLAGQDRG